MYGLAESIVKLKSEFVKTFKTKTPLYEVIPLTNSELLPIPDNDLKLLHKFAKNNPIYSNFFETRILGISCIVYGGDSNQYWLGSIKHDTSYAPFYTTWILSAYAIAITAKTLGFTEAIDIGSGDGRIAYCCKVVGLDSHGIEIDENLVELQKQISISTQINFKPQKGDATQFDYSTLDLRKPVFVIGGLPEVGEMLANSVIGKIKSDPKLDKKSGFVLAGSHAMRKFSKDTSMWGWGMIINNFGLDVIKTITLPTQWTVDQPFDTPYVFTIPHS